LLRSELERPGNVFEAQSIAAAHSEGRRPTRRSVDRRLQLKRPVMPRARETFVCTNGAGHVTECRAIDTAIDKQRSADVGGIFAPGHLSPWKPSDRSTLGRGGAQPPQI